jgi:hypothetical protein
MEKGRKWALLLLAEGGVWDEAAGLDDGWVGR